MSNDTIAQRKAHAIEKLTHDRDAAIARAEAEKIRADAAEVRSDDLAAIAAQLEAECRGWKELHILRGKAIDDLTAERDEARRELQHIRTLLDDGSGNEDDTALDMVKRLHERYCNLRMSIVNNVSA